MATKVGYNTVIKTSGASTGMVDEAMSGAGAGPYQLNTAAKRILDRDVLPTFEDGGVPIAGGDVVSIDYMTGKATFSAPPGGAVTMATGSYMPMTVVAQAHTASISHSGEVLDVTDFVLAQADPFHVRVSGLRDVTVTIGRHEDLSDTFVTIIQAGDPVVIEFRPGGSTKSFRLWAVLETEDQSGDVTDLEEDNLTFLLDGDDEILKSYSFDT